MQVNGCSRKLQWNPEILPTKKEKIFQSTYINQELTVFANNKKCLML